MGSKGWVRPNSYGSAGEFDHKDVNKKEVEFIVDKAIYFAQQLIKTCLLTFLIVVVYLRQLIIYI